VDRLPPQFTPRWRVRRVAQRQPRNRAARDAGPWHSNPSSWRTSSPLDRNCIYSWRDSGATLDFMEDYNHKQDYFRPDIQRSKILRRDGDDFLVNLRFFKKKVITTVIDTDHQVHYHIVDSTHAWSRSHTTRIQEVEDFGETTERLEPQGHDRGFLWSMDTYWRFQEKDGGTYVECQSLSLTRDIPTGLGWMVGPFVTSVPRESLTFTLVTVRSAELQRISSHPVESGRR
jgi:hypothetical protein